MVDLIVSLCEEVCDQGLASSITPHVPHSPEQALVHLQIIKDEGAALQAHHASMAIRVIKAVGSHFKMRIAYQSADDAWIIFVTSVLNFQPQTL